MHPEDIDLKRLQKDLNTRIFIEVRSAILRGSTSLDAVAKVIQKDCDWMIERLGKLLANRLVRIKIQHAFRTVSVPSEKAAKATGLPSVSHTQASEPEPEQTQLWFEEMEEFRAVPDVVAYRNRKGEVEYMLYRRMTKRERDGADAVLLEQERQDAQRRNAQFRANHRADELMMDFGDLPVEELVRLHRERRGHAAAGKAQ
jgi:hypothetical protein